MRVTWSAHGRGTATNAMAHIAVDRPDAAAAWLERLHERVASVGRFPFSGRIVPELNKPDHREILLTPYRVIYRVDSKRVYVLLIHHGRRTLGQADLGDV